MICNKQTPRFEQSVAFKVRLLTETPVEDVVNNSLARFWVKRVETVILYFPVSNTVYPLRFLR